MLHRRHPILALALVPAAALALVVAGCGGGGGGGAGGDLSDTLKYLPPNAAGVAVISTDVEGSQFKNLDDIFEARAHRRIESFFEDAASEGGLSYQKDIKPLLGHEVVYGGGGGLPGIFFGGGTGTVVVFHATSGGKLRDVLEKSSVFKR